MLLSHANPLRLHWMFLGLGLGVIGSINGATKQSQWVSGVGSLGVCDRQSFLPAEKTSERKGPFGPRCTGKGSCQSCFKKSMQRVGRQGCQVQSKPTKPQFISLRSALPIWVRLASSLLTKLTTASIRLIRVYRSRHSPKVPELISSAITSLSL